MQHDRTESTPGGVSPAGDAPPVDPAAADKGGAGVVRNGALTGPLAELLDRILLATEAEDHERADEAGECRAVVANCLQAAYGEGYVDGGRGSQDEAVAVERIGDHVDEAEARALAAVMARRVADAAVNLASLRGLVAPTVAALSVRREAQTRAEQLAVRCYGMGAYAVRRQRAHALRLAVDRIRDGARRAAAYDGPRAHALACFLHLAAEDVIEAASAAEREELAALETSGAAAGVARG